MSDRAALRTAVAAVRALYDAAACSLALVDEDGSTLVYVVADGVGADEIVGVSLPVSRGIAGWTAMSGQPMVVSEVAADARFARDVAESTHYVPTTILTAPLFDADGEASGVVSVLDPGVVADREWTLAVLGTLAAVMGLLVATGDGTPGTEDQARLAALGRRVLDAVEDLGP
ncbi:hypothetical protein GCM10009623_33710 [Nocardioides aestuarii]|uniref:GAF domain-containing protein n=1 Tax=Nocardioides aestuarii TaxID=252231 RepID=A0ABW4TRC8_9ACTN